MNNVSTRAQIITRRTYCRPTNADGTTFETWEQVIDRVIRHQRWLWERALTHKTMPDMPLHDVTEDMHEWVRLNEVQEGELEQLRDLMLERKVAVSGRTFWLGGTDIGKLIEASQFNCAALNIETVYDFVDAFWLLLNGAGVGFRPVAGTLTGFNKPIKNLKIIRSKGATAKGRECNLEEWDSDTKTWCISVGDSAVAWAKFIGKLLAGKHNAETLILDFSEIRKAGLRLKNYGWISQGDKGLASASEKIFRILNSKSDSLLTATDILDIGNLLGTILSTRRSAQIAIYNYEDPEWAEFTNFKNGMFENDNSHRTQSNNSLYFRSRPKKLVLTKLFEQIMAGGGEPGIINGETMSKRSPWASLTNPCGEILLPASGGFCCLTTINLSKFDNNIAEILAAAKLITRANYRQTVVDFRDGILQEKWHLNNEHLHLCGVSMMGVVESTLQPYDYSRLERIITASGYAMAEELDKPHPKQLTTLKPEGTISKCYDSTEGMHKPLGKYIFNNVAFSVHDPLVDTLKKANYRVFTHPYDPSAMLATLPIKYDRVSFDVVEGKAVNYESALEQLDRYKMLMQYYAHQNVSCTISYDPSEASDIVDWIYHNWDNYVAVSFLIRNDPSKTAKDLGYPYLPQEVVTKEDYDEYVKQLLPIDLTAVTVDDSVQESDCASGACPIR